MATKTIRARLNTCDYTDCRHEWLSVEIPDRCARCKRRRWNKGGFPLPEAPATRPRSSKRERGASEAKSGVAA